MFPNSTASFSATLSWCKHTHLDRLPLPSSPLGDVCCFPLCLAAGKRGGPFWTRVSIVFSSSACQGGQSVVGCLQLVSSLIKLILCLVFALCSLGAFFTGGIQRCGGTTPGWALLEPWWQNQVLALGDTVQWILKAKASAVTSDLQPYRYSWRRNEITPVPRGYRAQDLNFGFRLFVLIFSKWGYRLAVPDPDCLLCCELHLGPQKEPWRDFIYGLSIGS